MIHINRIQIFDNKIGKVLFDMPRDKRYKTFRGVERYRKAMSVIYPNYVIFFQYIEK